MASGSDASAAAPDTEAFSALLFETRSRWPRRDDVLREWRVVAARLDAFAAGHPDAVESAEARALAAEVCILGGDRDAAVRHWRWMSESATRPEDRARGRYLLGEHYFLLAEPGQGRGSLEARDRALRYFRSLLEQQPGSPWEDISRRLVEYLELPRGGEAPRFRAEFESGGERVVMDFDQLRGKVVLLLFWKAGIPAQGDFQKNLAASLERVLREYPALEGQFEVLGVSLDPDRALFERALRDWQVSWPQLHDARGFQSDFARQFHIPRTPHYVVIDKDAKCRYIGAQSDAFLTQASAALREKRLGLEGASGER